MKNLYIILVLIFSGTLAAQRNLENANWITGTTWLDFNNNTLTTPSVPSYGTTVTALSPQPVYETYEGCASISDEDGRPLFFTDGLRVYRIINGETEIIDYSSPTDELFGNGSSFQNVIIIPRPNHPGVFYLITITGYSFQQTPTKGLYWSELNLNLGSSGQFVSRNNVMSEGTTVFNHSFGNRSEAITSCIAANGVDMWLVVHQENTNYSKLLSYLVTEDGIDPIPWDFVDLQSLNGPTDYSLSLKISPDTTRLAFVMRSTISPYLGTFDNLTGAFNLNTNPIGNTSINGFYYGVEFSPDSQTLFYSRNNVGNSRIFAVDANSPAIESSVFNGAVFFGALQRGLNDRIYVTDFGAQLKEINNPNDFGLWNVTNVTLTSSPGFGLPQWIWPTCKNTLTLIGPADDVNGTNSRREREQWIDASNVIFPSTTTSTIYHAGDFVELNPGFEAEFGSRFSAYVEGCSGNYAYKPGTSGSQTNPKEPAKSINEITIYPNPTNNLLNISSGQELRNITIMSIDGKLMFDQPANQREKQIDVSNFANGVYIITVQTQDGKVLNSKFIKN